MPPDAGRLNENPIREEMQVQPEEIAPLQEDPEEDVPAVNEPIPEPDLDALKITLHIIFSTLMTRISIDRIRTKDFLRKYLWKVPLAYTLVFYLSYYYYLRGDMKKCLEYTCVIFEIQEYSEYLLKTFDAIYLCLYAILCTAYVAKP